MNESESWLALAKTAVRAAAMAAADAGAAARTVTGIDLAGRETKLAIDHQLDALLARELAPSGLPIFSEESGAAASGPFWVVDPLDGSVNFLRGAGPSVISVALCDGAAPLFGVLCQVGTSNLVWGGPGLGAWDEAGRLCVSTVERDDRALLCTGFPARLDTSDPMRLTAYYQTIGRFAKVRMIGSAAASLLMVARGIADAYYEERIMFWDVAAGAALVAAAGGQVILQGDHPERPYTVTATNGRLRFAS